MITSLERTEEHLELLKATVAEVLSLNVTALEEVGGGRNSRIYRVTAQPHACYALKTYFQHPCDQRTRLRTEFDSFSFLWQNGVRNIPRPIAASDEHQLALYVWIDGMRIDPQHVSGETIRAAASFLGQLADLRSRTEYTCFGPASEACFSGLILLANVRHRLELLLSQKGRPELQVFLSERFIPALETISKWSRDSAGPATFDVELDHDLRILSPSDFGFHNALRNQGGKIFFLDFEYFGWDDPAKTISDFLLHPAMRLTAPLKRQFVTAAIQNLSCPNGFTTRLKALYPLYGLKWCLILLNEFLPEQLLRRRFAGSAKEIQRTQMEQLAKAEEKLQQTLSEYEHPSYLN
jgi:hypothetical protein